MISDIDTVARLLLAAVPGRLIGFERECLLWAAGIRTHRLVCVNVCRLIIISGFKKQVVCPVRRRRSKKPIFTLRAANQAG